MTSLATMLSWLLVFPVGCLLTILLVELVAGLWPARRPPEWKSPPPETTTILMPAHDEARGIAAILDALAPKLGPAMKLLVIADNCSDDTADIARTKGFTVLERHDPGRRGKGFALAFGRDHLAADPPDCVIILDADCTVDEESLPRLAHAAIGWDAPVQSCYLMQSDPKQSPMVQISNFAFLVKNLVRQRGCARLGTPALLGGTGMAFPWRLFKSAPLASANMVEDLELGIAFSKAGNRPRFLEQARTWSVAAAEGDTLTQRTRWEHGFVQTAANSAIPLLSSAIGGRAPKLFWLGLDLLVPPLALLMMLGGSMLVLLVFIAWATGVHGPAYAVAILLALNGAALGLAWYRWGRQVIGIGTLMRIPAYILWKVPVYLKLAGKRETRWVRTRREGE